MRRAKCWVLLAGSSSTRMTEWDQPASFFLTEIVSYMVVGRPGRLPQRGFVNLSEGTGFSALVYKGGLGSSDMGVCLVSTRVRNRD